MQRHRRVRGHRQREHYRHGDVPAGRGPGGRHGQQDAVHRPEDFRRQLTVTIDSDQTITVVIRLRNSQGVQVQRRGPVVRGANLFQIVMNIPNSRPNGKYKAQVTMTNQFGTQKVQTGTSS